MALIACPDCRKQVSDAALGCVHCGRPLTAPLARTNSHQLLSLLSLALKPYRDGYRAGEDIGAATAMVCGLFTTQFAGVDMDLSGVSEGFGGDGELMLRLDSHDWFQLAAMIKLPGISITNYQTLEKMFPRGRAVTEKVRLSRLTVEDRFVMFWIMCSALDQ
jgi:hypothetical protein